MTRPNNSTHPGGGGRWNPMFAMPLFNCCMPPPLPGGGGGAKPPPRGAGGGGRNPPPGGGGAKPPPAGGGGGGAKPPPRGAGGGGARNWLLLLLGGGGGGGKPMFKKSSCSTKSRLRLGLLFLWSQQGSTTIKCRRNGKMMTPLCALAVSSATVAFLDSSRFSSVFRRTSCSQRYEWLLG